MEAISRRRFVSVAAAGSAMAAASAVMHSSAYGAEAPTAPTQWDYEADVVCVGSGSGGSTSAYFALEGGLSAIVLESMDLLGGGSILNAGEIALGGGTALQKHFGYEDSPENFKAFLTHYGNQGIKEELLDLYVESGPEVCDWLTQIGVVFPDQASNLNVYYYDSEEHGCFGLMSQGSEFHPWFSNVWNAVPTCHMSATYKDAEEVDQYADASGSRSHGHDGTGYMLPIIHAVKNLGGKYMCNTRATHVYKDETGRVVGVQAEASDGSAINIKANKGVVLAGGDWTSDAELKARFAPKWVELPGYPMAVGGNDGTALRMGLEAGGICVNGESMWCGVVNTGFGAWGLQQYDETGGQFPGGQSIIVDDRGTRTFCEDLYMSYAATKIAEMRIDRADAHAYNIMTQETFQKQVDAVTALGWGYMVQEDECTFADSIEELAEKLDMPFLVDTLTAYNRYAAEGTDPQFNRRPGNISVIDGPVVAGRMVTEWQFYSQGGLDIDVYGHVLAFDGTPIPGLFAAGRSARGLAEGKYTQVTGMSCGAGIIMGRQIGRELAAGDPHLEV